MRRLALAVGCLILTVSAIGACAPKSTWEECVPNHPLACTVVDGMALGLFVGSKRPDSAPCAGECHDTLGAAVAALKSQDPDHPPILWIEEFQPDMRPVCQGQPCAVSGQFVIYVFSFGGDAILPITVRCPGISACSAVVGSMA